MSFNEKELQIIEFGVRSGKTESEVLEAVRNFRAKTPVRPQEDEEEKPSILATVGRTIADIPGDIKETFQGSVEAVSRGMETADEAVGQVIDGEVSPEAGTVKTIGGGLRAGAEIVGQGIIGAGKAVLPQSAEDAIGSKVQQFGESIGKSEPVQFLVNKYESLNPNQKAIVDGLLGTAEGLGTMFGLGPATRAIRTGISIPTQSALSGAQTVGRTALDVGSTILERGAQNIRDIRVPAVVSGTGNVVRGTAQQARDFGTRTVRGAQETAEFNRMLRNLPEPEANLLRTGVDERLVGVLRETTPTEASVYQRLVDQAKLKANDPTPNTQQPKVIAGQEFMKPVEHIIETRNQVGRQLGELRKNLSGEKVINTNPQFRNFHQYLTEDLGLKIDSKGNIKSGVGRVAQSDLKEVQKIYNELRSKTFASQKEIDEFLQRTFKEYDLRQAREKTFSDDVSRVAERARAEMRKAMPEEYNELATQYAQLSKPLQDTVKLLTYKGSLDDLTAKDLRAGEVALRVLGNAADRPQSVIDDVLEMARQTGFESDVDLNKVLWLTDQLEDLYDITPTRGFSGSASRGVEQAGAGVLGDVARMDATSLFSKIVGSKATREEIQEAFEAYIKSLATE